MWSKAQTGRWTSKAGAWGRMMARCLEHMHPYPMYVRYWLGGGGGTVISLPFAQAACEGRVRGKRSVGKGNSRSKETEPDKGREVGVENSLSRQHREDLD